MIDILKEKQLCIRSNKQEKAHAGNATQHIHPPLIQKTLIHIQTHIVTYCINHASTR